MQEFKTLSDMIEFLQTQRDDAVARTPESMEVAVGDHVLRMESIGSKILAIYGTITDPLDYWLENPPETEDDRAEMDYEVRCNARDREDGFTFGKWYSEMCPDGEFGTAHRSTLDLKLSPENFERARALNFTSSSDFLIHLITHSAAGLA